MNSDQGCGGRRSAFSNCSANKGPAGGEALEDIRQEQFYIEKLKEQRLKVKALKDDYDRKEEEINELGQELKGLELKAAPLAAVRLQYQTTLTDTEKLALENKAAGSQVVELKETLAGLKHQSYKNQVLVLRKEASSAAAALQYCNIKKQRLEKTLANLTKDREELRASRQSELQSYKLKWEKLCSDLNELQAEQAKVQEANVYSGKRIANQVGELDRLVSQKEQFQIRAKRLAEEAFKGKLQVLAIKGKSQTEIRKLNDQISDVEITKNKLAGEIDKKKAVVYELKKKDKENEARLGQLGNELAKVEGRAGLCETQLLKSRSLVADLQATTGQEQAEIRRLKAEVGKLEREGEEAYRRRVQQTKCRGSAETLMNQLIRQKNEEARKLDQLVGSFRKK